MSAAVSLRGVAKSQSFGGRLASASKRLSPAMAADLHYLFTEAESVAGLKSLTYGPSDGAQRVGSGTGVMLELSIDCRGGDRDDNGFVHLFAQEKAVLRLSEQKNAKRYRAAREALKAMAARGDSVLVCLLYAYYGPRAPDERKDIYGDMAGLVEYAPSVLERRDAMARRIASERVAEAELAAFAADQRSDAVAQDIAQAERDARALVQHARDVYARGRMVAERAALRKPKSAKAIAKAQEQAVARALQSARRIERIAALEERLSVAVERRRKYGANASLRSTPSSREVARAAITISADREVTTGEALRDLMRAQTSKVKRASLVAKLRREADRTLAKAEDVYRAAFWAAQGAT